MSIHHTTPGPKMVDLVVEAMVGMVAAVEAEVILAVVGPITIPSPQLAAAVPTIPGLTKVMPAECNPVTVR